MDEYQISLIFKNIKRKVMELTLMIKTLERVIKDETVNVSDPIEECET